MKNMKITMLLLSCLLSLEAVAQELEWILNNNSSNIGERVISVIEVSSIGTYSGIGFVGTVTDYNGNWGYNYPTASEFTGYVKFSPTLSYGIIQEKLTTNIYLRIRKISDTKVHLIAYFPNSHRGARVQLKKLIGHASMVMGDPDVINSSGELVLAAPEYTSFSVTNHSIGDVGIGTQNPDAKLTVAGDIHSQEVKIVVDAGADFVFENDYKLPALEYLEKYLKRNKHLPEIPSEKEMQENGLYLAEMNIKLLQKIEELTLYTIAQEKKLDKQNKSLEDMETKFLELQKRLEKLE